MVGVGAAGFVPIAFVDGDHFAGVAGDAAVGEEVRWVGEDQIDGIFWDGGEDFEAVALVEAEVVFGVVEGGSGQVRSCGVAVGRIGNGFGHRTIWIVDQIGIVDQEVKRGKSARPATVRGRYTGKGSIAGGRWVVRKRAAARINVCV